jgi:hypothetical protein
MDRDAILAELL